MTASAEARVPDGPDELLGPRRREAASAQRTALPSGRVVLTCTAALDAGGSGRHASEIRTALDRGGEPPACISGDSRASPARSARRSPRHALGSPT